MKSSLQGVKAASGDESLEEEIIGGFNKMPVSNEKFNALGTLGIYLGALKNTEKVKASVAIIMTGIAPVEKDGIGKVQLVKDHIMVEALPRDLPHDIKVDISNLNTLQDGIFVSDLVISDKVTILDDEELPVVVVSQLQKEEVEEVVAAPADAAWAATAAAIEAEKAAKKVE